MLQDWYSRSWEFLLDTYVAMISEVIIEPKVQELHTKSVWKYTSQNHRHQANLAKHDNYASDLLHVQRFYHYQSLGHSPVKPDRTSNLILRGFLLGWAESGEMEFSRLDLGIWLFISVHWCFCSQNRGMLMALQTHFHPLHLRLCCIYSKLFRLILAWLYYDK